MDKEEILRQEELLTVDEVARILRVTPRTVHELARSGELSCAMITPRQRKFELEDIKRFIQARKPVPPRKVDTPNLSALPSVATSHKGGETRRLGNSARAQLREEMRQWR